MLTMYAGEGFYLYPCDHCHEWVQFVRGTPVIPGAGSEGSHVWCERCGPQHRYNGED